MTGPTIRVELELGDYRPTIDEDDTDWHPVAYAVIAHHRTELSSDALHVRERVLEGLTLRLTNNEPDALDDLPQLVNLPLPLTPEGLHALSLILDHAREYLTQE